MREDDNQSKRETSSVHCISLFPCFLRTQSISRRVWDGDLQAGGLLKSAPGILHWGGEWSRTEQRKTSNYNSVWKEDLNQPRRKVFRAAHSWDKRARLLYPWDNHLLVTVPPGKQHDFRQGCSVPRNLRRLIEGCLPAALSAAWDSIHHPWVRIWAIYHSGTRCLMYTRRYICFQVAKDLNL